MSSKGKSGGLSPDAANKWRNKAPNTDDPTATLGFDENPSNPPGFWSSNDYRTKWLAYQAEQRAAAKHARQQGVSTTQPPPPGSGSGGNSNGIRTLGNFGDSQIGQVDVRTDLMKQLEGSLLSWFLPMIMGGPQGIKGAFSGLTPEVPTGPAGYTNPFAQRAAQPGIMGSLYGQQQPQVNALARGGQLDPNMWNMVGENGPEMIPPGATGQVLPLGTQTNGGPGMMPPPNMLGFNGAQPTQMPFMDFNAWSAGRAEKGVIDPSQQQYQSYVADQTASRGMGNFGRGNVTVGPDGQSTTVNDYWHAPQASVQQWWNNALAQPGAGTYGATPQGATWGGGQTTTQGVDASQPVGQVGQAYTPGVNLSTTQHTAPGGATPAAPPPPAGGMVQGPGQPPPLQTGGPTPGGVGPRTQQATGYLTNQAPPPAGGPGAPVVNGPVGGNAPPAAPMPGLQQGILGGGAFGADSPFAAGLGVNSSQGVANALREQLMGNINAAITQARSQVPSMYNSGAGHVIGNAMQGLTNDANVATSQAMLQGRDQDIAAGRAQTERVLGAGQFGQGMTQLGLQEALGFGQLGENARQFDSTFGLNAQNQQWQQTMQPIMQMIMSWLGMATPTGYQTVVGSR